jgi:IS1 family transposase
VGQFECVTGAAKNTVTKLLMDLARSGMLGVPGRGVVDLPCTRIECDEIWSFCYAKEKNVPADHRDEFGYGDVWTWTAICADTKLVPTWLIGERDGVDAEVFMRDLASRLRNHIQLTTDGHLAYLHAVEAAFGGDIDYAMLHKIYASPATPEDQRRYSPATCLGIDLGVVSGQPDTAKASTSYVERQNLSMRMGMRRFTRVTNGFSKKVENLTHAVSLHYMHYNFARPHGTLTKDRGGYKTTPAMAAGITDRIWTHRDIAALLD